MTATERIFFLTGYLLAGLIMVLTWPDPTQKQVGKTWWELREMKESCEKDLTRSENCIIIVSYKPEGKEEESK